MLQYISDIDHYNQVLARVASVKRSLWIGTAHIKDLHVKVGETTKPFLAVIACLFVAVWKCASFMPRSLDRTSVRIMTDILFSITAWSGYYALMCISRC